MNPEAEKMIRALNEGESNETITVKIVEIVKRPRFLLLTAADEDSQIKIYCNDFVSKKFWNTFQVRWSLYLV